MSVFRVLKNKNYTVMSNTHLKDLNLSLKAKGLLSLMLSLPDEWDYSIRGLVAICKENETAIKSALKELQEYKYLTITKLYPNKEENRSTIEHIYNIFEVPQIDSDSTDSDNLDNSFQHHQERSSYHLQVENLPLDNLSLENQVQLNTKELNTKELNTFTKEKIVKKESNNHAVEKSVKSNNTKTYTDPIKKKIISAINEYTSNQEIKDKIFSILRLRTRQNKPNTIEFIKSFLDRLDRFSKNSDDDKINLLDYSIENGYITVFDVLDYISLSSCKK